MVPSFVALGKLIALSEFPGNESGEHHEPSRKSLALPIEERYLFAVSTSGAGVCGVGKGDERKDGDHDVKGARRNSTGIGANVDGGPVPCGIDPSAQVDASRKYSKCHR